MAADDDRLVYKIAHLFQPRLYLPQSHDGRPEREQSLISSILESACEFHASIRYSSSGVDSAAVDQWLRICRMLTHFSEITRGSNVPMDAALLANTVKTMETGDIRLVYICAQNAGIIFRNIDGVGLTFESFRASLPNEIVVGTETKVKVQYPGTPRLPVCAEEEAREILFNYIAGFHTMVFSDARPQAMKAGKAQDEHREPPHSWYITDLLPDILRAYCSELADDQLPPTDYIEKRIDDHVLWHDALLPWRRSPILLVLKVALQTSLLHVPDQIGYKAFMVFALARVLREATDAAVSDDVLSLMNRKLARRLYKLRHADVERFPISVAAGQVRSTAQLLDDHWKSVQRDEEQKLEPIDLQLPSPNAIAAAEVFSLLRSGPYLEKVRCRENTSNSTSSEALARFEATLPTTYRANQQSPPSPFSASAPLPELLAALHDVAAWLSSPEHSHWLEVASVENVCYTLRHLLDEMMSASRRFSSSGDDANPQLFSFAFLNMMDLWVLVDKAMVALSPLFAEYTPELTSAPLNALLLPDWSQMERLSRIEHYIAQRHRLATCGSAFIMGPATSYASLFAARYARADEEMRQLHSTIRSRARDEKEKVLKELRDLNLEHADLVKEAGEIPHEYLHPVNGSGEQIHDQSCRKCRLESRAKSLTVRVFEEPLPDDSDLAHALVFELLIPPPFALWRSTTYSLIKTFARDYTFESDRAMYDTVGSYAIRRATIFGPQPVHPPGITLASYQKSFLVVHYRTNTVPCGEEDVVKPHALRWQFFDLEDNYYIPSPKLPTISIRKHCTPHLPEGPYSSLDWCVSGTKHASNQVIASQSLRPGDLTYHEYEAFGHLRAGTRLQWRNILLYMESGALRLSHPAVHLIIRQAAIQAEEPCKNWAVHREAHVDLVDEVFGRQLLEILRRRLESVRLNWQESWTASIFALITRRLMQLLPVLSAVRADAKAFLHRDLRSVVMGWMRDIRARISMTDLNGADEAKVRDLEYQFLQVCLAGKDTFSVDIGTFSEGNAVPDFLELTFSMHQYFPSRLSLLPRTLRYLVEIDILDAVASLPSLVASINGDHERLDTAVRREWRTFERDADSPWVQVGGHASPWFVCRTRREAEHTVSSTVHVNLLDGAFFVEGMSVKTLPKDMSEHPAYIEMFPHRRYMRIQPSRMPGMLYESHSADECEVHFQHDGPDLIIRIREENRQISEFVPSYKWGSDVPQIILMRHLALYRVGKEKIDFIPRDEHLGWNPQGNTAGSIDRIGSLPGLTWHASGLTGGISANIICPHSAIAQKLCKIFGPLEKSPQNLVISRSHVNQPSSLSVLLPRYRLRFRFEDRGLASVEFPRYVVSSVQSIGTLYGVDKLVLQAAIGPAQERILVPAGEDITVLCRNGHPVTSVSAPPYASTSPPLFIYDVDSCTDRLKTDGCLTSWLMLAYLHALSSSHQRDPLTKDRGVDVAARMLQSARCTAFTTLGREDRVLLGRIMALAPIRTFYPAHLRVMENINRPPSFSTISLDETFAPFVKQITAYARQLELLNPKAQSTAELAVSLPTYAGDEELRKRALRRASPSPAQERHWSPGIKPSLDRVYVPSSRMTEIGRRSIRNIAACLYRWRQYAVALPPDMWEEIDMWRKSDHSCFDPNRSVNVDFLRPQFLQLMPAPPDTWLSLYRQCTSPAAYAERHALVFAITSSLFRETISEKLANVLMALAMHAEGMQVTLKRISELIPQSQIDLSQGWDMRSSHSRAKLDGILNSRALAYRDSPEYGGQSFDKGLPPNQLYGRNLQDQRRKLIWRLTSEWPDRVHPTWPEDSNNSYYLYPTPPIRPSVCTLFQFVDNNRRLKGFADELQHTLENLPKRPVLPATTASIAVPPINCDNTPVPLPDPIPSLSQLMASRDVPTHRVLPFRTLALATTDQITAHEDEGVCHLLSRLGADSAFAEQYREDLAASASALSDRRSREVSRLREASMISLPADRDGLRHEDLIEALQPKSEVEKVVEIAGLWPTRSKQSILWRLANHRWRDLRPQWRNVITLWAESLAREQREQRIDRLQSMGQDSRKELATAIEYQRLVAGEGNYPDWLLIQLDSDVAVREIQSDIAQQMINGRNQLMQLNMGEGKSSVIIPLAATSCADGQNIVCVVVLKPLFTQMFRILSERVCGIANRRLFHLPVSRDTPITFESVRAIEQVLEDCQEQGGILLCQPEHLLSFQLLTSIRMLHNHAPDDENSRLLLGIHQRLTRHSRYILDESDEILSVKYQLAYTVGSAAPLQGQPERWLIIQRVLDIVNSQIEDTKRMYPDGVDADRKDHRRDRHFEHVRILSSEACQYLLKATVQDIVHHNRIPHLQLRGLSVAQREDVERFILTYDPADALARAVVAFSGDAYPCLLLLRGLFAHGILVLALKEKRWRVDYGLDLRRSRLAVPYRAKDSPALRAEFGQPDVVLVLTCFAHYYNGLSDKELDAVMQRLHVSDEPALRYEYWTKGLQLPPLEGVNMKDAAQRYTHIYPRLRRVKPVVDFYLAECVFPHEARTFEYKFTTNAWDLAKEKDRPTTGFSGTNDNQYLLPTSITQVHPKAQLHTNALVLAFVLRQENRTVVSVDGDSEGLLQGLVADRTRISVILDVGARILELDNAAVATRWLELDASSEIEAAAYFGEGDELYVRTRDGREEQLQRSFFRDQLEKVLVYVDELHTRGTDLQFPAGARAMVTLGPKLTKDKLVQGCMRMRKLGQPNGHSMMFFANTEIQTRIQESISERKDCLDSSDVLVWTMKESQRQTQEHGALWADQGLNFDRREMAWCTYESGEIDRMALVEVLREPEARSLEDLYAPGKASGLSKSCHAEGTERLRAILERCERFGFRISDNSRLLEEQERELAHETEQEREVHVAPPAMPLEHATDPALTELLRTGRLPERPAFRTLHASLAATSLEADIPSLSRTFFQDTNTVVTTRDFANTIRLPAHSLHGMDGYLRPVQWIVSMRREPETLLLISPHEADEILPEVRQSQDIRLHMYAPRVNHETRSFDDLHLPVVPSYAASSYRGPKNRVTHELDLFAGNLFLKDTSTYQSLCALLGLHLDAAPEGYAGVIDRDGFVQSREVRASLGISGCAFERSPAAFLRTLLSLRRKGQSFELTHLGQMLYGRALTAEDFPLEN
ncbi:hypothetical protein HDZ31DRAFT_29685 [Schizophyllum fasciatum]